ncbi:hypothetical protein AB6735_27250 [Mucilaginibacter sp. RCC_168]|uniref:hypothetical protein n=1 Tax=Mucilaginibacter sp. RCC_168 TaxID=3239221 RepID=UPI003525C0C3
MNLKSTVYGVFILESLKHDDYFDGENLFSIFNLSNIPTEYHWIDSKSHLRELLRDFRKSKFRYLYLSCHADEYGIEVNGDDVSNHELQKFTGNLTDIRIFMSACKGGNDRLAKLMISKSNILSLIGSPTDLDMDKAAVFWPSFFYVMKEIDEKKMNRMMISKTLKKLVDIFNTPINYYSKISNDKNFMRRLKIRPGKNSDNIKLKINL